MTLQACQLQLLPPRTVIRYATKAASKHDKLTLASFGISNDVDMSGHYRGHLFGQPTDLNLQHS